MNLRPRPAKTTGGRVAVNLVDQFDNAAFVNEWLHGVTDLAAEDCTGIQLPVQPGGAPPEAIVGHIGCSNSAPTSLHAGERPLEAQQCMPSSVYGQFGAQLPSNVWVDLEILEYDSAQWGNVKSFLGNVEQVWWEDEVQWFGVQFQPPIGWRKLAVTDCHSLDYMAPRVEGYTRRGRRSPLQSPPHDGSVDVHMNQMAVAPGVSEEANTPNWSLQCPRDSSLPTADSNQQPRVYSPFSHWDGFTSDSMDSNWMAEFRDFTDWLIGNDGGRSPGAESICPMPGAVRVARSLADRRRFTEFEDHMESTPTASDGSTLFDDAPPTGL